MSEAPQVMASFAAYYLATDAEEIFIYLDTPNEDAERLANLFAHQPRLKTQICDEAYWSDFGGRPEHAHLRQIANARSAYDACPSDWLFHCDADEFLLSSDRAVTLLAGCEGADFASVPVVERVHVPGEDRSKIFSSTFRKLSPSNRPDLIEDLYGDFHHLLVRNVAAHHIGKSFVRCGRGIEMRLHNPNEKGAANHPGTQLSELSLAHIDGFSEYSLTLKYLRKMKGRRRKGALFDAYSDFKNSRPNDHHTQTATLKKREIKTEQRFAVNAKRDAQMRYVMEIYSDPGLLRAFYKNLKTVDAAQTAKLEDLDLLFVQDLKIVENLEKYFPGAEFALDVDTYDNAFANMVE